ncbi:Saccharopine dehydrogenase-domain-containing protein [Hypoxylon sp. FL1284]|nr:Saccharopine dehydrogenase-domain-containing protein [Hypoxylon sp. FL1284]
MDAAIEERRKSRKYDFLLLGATGYTGLLTAEFIARHLPSDLKWAIAGRSSSKLEALAKKLDAIDPKRSQPAIEVVSLEHRSQLDSVIKDSKVCISVILYEDAGEIVIQSCVENGTDYLDVSGDIPLVRTFVDKYHEMAADAGVVLIHSCGVFSAPHDLLTQATVRKLAEGGSARTKEVILSVSELELNVSGGTAHSLLDESTYEPLAHKRARQPWVLSPTEGPKTSASTSFLGLRRDPVLGLLSASSISAAQNRALVHRTWGLLNGTSLEYGPNFQFNEYAKAPSTVGGVLSVLTATILDTLLRFGFVRSIARRLLPAPGEGPDPEKTQCSPVKFEVVAIPDSDDTASSPRAYASFSYPSGPYHATALVLAEAAASLLYTRSLEGQVPGGCLTPAFLGNDLLERVKKSGGTVEIKLI